MSDLCRINCCPNIVLIGLKKKVNIQFSSRLFYPEYIILKEGKHTAALPPAFGKPSLFAVVTKRNLWKSCLFCGCWAILRICLWRDKWAELTGLSDLSLFYLPTIFPVLQHSSSLWSLRAKHQAMWWCSEFQTFFLNLLQAEDPVKGHSLCFSCSFVVPTHPTPCQPCFPPVPLWDNAGSLFPCCSSSFLARSASVIRSQWFICDIPVWCHRTGESAS